MFIGTLSWDPWLMAALAICGLFVVGVTALLSRRLGKVGGAVTGLFCGLLPSLLILVWLLFIARPNFMAAAGAFGGSCWNHLLWAEESICDVTVDNGRLHQE